MDISKEDWMHYKANADEYLEIHCQYSTKQAVDMAMDRMIAKPRLLVKGRYMCPDCGGDGCYSGRQQLRFCNICGQRFERD